MAGADELPVLMLEDPALSTSMRLFMDSLAQKTAQQRIMRDACRPCDRRRAQCVSVR